MPYPIPFSSSRHVVSHFNHQGLPPSFPLKSYGCFGAISLLLLLPHLDIDLDLGGWKGDRAATTDTHGAGAAGSSSLVRPKAVAVGWILVAGNGGPRHRTTSVGIGLCAVKMTADDWLGEGHTVATVTKVGGGTNVVRGGSEGEGDGTRVILGGW